MQLWEETTYIGFHLNPITFHHSSSSWSFQFDPSLIQSTYMPHLLLIEEEWHPFPIEGLEGIDDSYYLSLYYVVSRCLMSHDDSSLERHLFWSFDVIFYHSIKNTFQYFQFIVYTI